MGRVAPAQAGHVHADPSQLRYDAAHTACPKRPCSTMAGLLRLMQAVHNALSTSVLTHASSSAQADHISYMGESQSCAITYVVTPKKAATHKERALMRDTCMEAKSMVSGI